MIDDELKKEYKKLTINYLQLVEKYAELQEKYAKLLSEKEKPNPFMVWRR